MTEPRCKTCVHYFRHYILDRQRCTPIDCGHCGYPRIKHREPNHRACDRYELRKEPPNLPDRDRVIHYLTTEFLQFVLEHALPPEIDDREP